MEKIINRLYATPEENNTLLEQGFKFKVEGDWELFRTIYGEICHTGRVHYFTDETEATAYADAQRWVYNPERHGKVEIVKREETREEREKRFVKEETAKAEAKARKEEEKARALGMSVEQYRIMKQKEAKKKRLAREIAKLTEEVKQMQKEIKRKQKLLETL